MPGNSGRVDVRMRVDAVMRQPLPMPVGRLASPGSPVVIAHRGGAKLRPENTILAFEHALDLGVDAIECDVRSSRDGDVVVIHDESVDRTTDGTGPVSAYTADELSRLDAAHHFGAREGFVYRRRGFGVPRLSHLLRLTGELPVVVEIKGDDVGTAHRVLDVVGECGAARRVVVAGFSHAVLSAVRQRAPDLVTGASKVEVRSALRRSYLHLRPRATGFRLFQVPTSLQGKPVLTRRLMKALTRAGIPVHVWIVDDPSEMRMLLEWGVCGIVSDRPDLALAAVAAFRS
jgi:glycerophosphoryl diester phosphodiesterase